MKLHRSMSRGGRPGIKQDSRQRMNSVQTAVSQTSPPKKSFLYDPKVRGIFYQVVLVAAIVFLFYVAATNAIENLQRAKIASGFGFLEQHGRLRHQPDADPVQRGRRNLWRCLHRRPAQHPARLGHRHLLHDLPRLRHRHRAPVQELDGGEGRDGLCRGAAQHPAAGAAAVLVHRRARHPAAAAQLRSRWAPAST